jgi:putative RNA 2'-phosphotransferase
VFALKIDKMLTPEQEKHISKLLSLVLRHQPDSLGIILDEQGWTDVTILIEKINNKGIQFSFNDLQLLVANNNKKRFALNESETLIRANQGHSIEVNLGYEPKQPPAILFHGTGHLAVDSIKSTGLEKRNRQHVHLSVDIETAVKVGQRHGKPVVFTVAAQVMFEQGYQFYVADNGVWLTEHVPPQFLTIQ